MNRAHPFISAYSSGLVALVMMAITACHPKQDLARSTLANKTPNYLLARMPQPAAELQWYTAKATTQVVQGLPGQLEGGKETSFKAAVKLRRDSLFWASISPALGIEVVRALVSPDSVMFINKLKDQYFAGALTQLSEQVGIELSLSQLQGLFWGEALDFDPDEKYKSSVEGYRYVLSSKTKKRFFKAAENKEAIIDSSQSYLPGFNEKRLERLREKQEELLILRKYYISPENFLVTAIEVVDLANEQVLEVEYADHEKVSGVLLPKKITLFASNAANTLHVEMALSKIKVNEPRSMPFRIPQKYERIH